MKKIVLASLLLASLPYLSFAQSGDDDLYFIPKKKTEKKASTTQTVNQVIPNSKSNAKVNYNYSPTVVVKDASGKSRDVDEYNRRYTSRDNNFSLENDTLYVEEKPLSERGEWVNGFDGSQSDYEYAMRIVRFRNPRYAIPMSSPLYWDVLYTLPSWEWNVYDDGFYAYAFPTYSNRLWWDWRWNYPFGGGWGFNYSWYSPWYSNWYSPSWSWGFNYGWGGPYYGHHHYWDGPYWGGGRPSIGHGGWNRNGIYDNRRGPYMSSRTSSGRVQNQSSRIQSNRLPGRVVNGNDGQYSVRPQRTVQPNRSGSVSRGDRDYPSTSYSRPSMNRGESTYSRPSSTRSSVREGNNNALNRSYDSNRSYNSSRSSSYQSGRSSSSNSSSFRSSSSGSSSRSSFGGGSSTSGGSRRR